MEHREGQAIARVNAIGTAVPAADVNASYTQWAIAQLPDPREARLFQRMADRSGIAHRYSVLAPSEAKLAPETFYNDGIAPGTGERMRRYAEHAPELALEAVAQLSDLGEITHLLVASCTGFMAPGLDQVIARRLGLDPGVERIAIGFMGCYAGITLLRTAAHIVRSDSSARVLAISVELSTLHLQETQDIEALLAMGQFADGAAAALVTGSGEGLSLGEGISATLENSEELITWTVGDTGFAMQLSGEVPGRLAEAFATPALADQLRMGGEPEAWAIHPGGRSILDAVERGLDLAPDALDASRAVLTEFGNMSSATILFVLEQMMAKQPQSGVAIAFGPGLAMEAVRFGWTGHNAG